MRIGCMKTHIGWRKRSVAFSLPCFRLWLPTGCWRSQRIRDGFKWMRVLRTCALNSFRGSTCSWLTAITQTVIFFVLSYCIHRIVSEHGAPYEGWSRCSGLFEPKCCPHGQRWRMNWLWITLNGIFLFWSPCRCRRKSLFLETNTCLRKCAPLLVRYRSNSSDCPCAIYEHVKHILEKHKIGKPGPWSQPCLASTSSWEHRWVMRR